VKLPKSPSQNVEAKELTFVLDYINGSPKGTAFGNEGEYVAAVWDFCLSVLFCFSKRKKQANLPYHQQKTRIQKTSSHV
jgi:NET1-associated nuclear protein 1 (U3 small nucleolar RNA-associated protein 17)